MARRVERLLERFLAEEAERETGGFEPWLLEAGFGEEEDSERPALELDGWGLHGAIDRVDRAPDGRALVIDYKLSGSVTPREKFEEQAKLQLPLYLLAVAEHWGAEPVGGLYHPLRGTSIAAPARRRPRRGGRATSPLRPLRPRRGRRRGAGGAAGGLAAAGRARSSPACAPARSAATPARGAACAATTSAPPSATSRRSAAATAPPQEPSEDEDGRSGERARARRPSRRRRSRPPARDVLLEAGAGTGKTGVMVDRYCRLVCDEGVAPDAILAFTFTDKAAAELRQRIRAERSRPGRGRLGAGRGSCSARSAAPG